MPIAWYLCPFDTARAVDGRSVRRCAIARFLPRERADGTGPRWEEAEVRGQRCLVKVDAGTAMLDALDADADLQRVPHATVSIPAGQRTVLRARLVALGYPGAAVDATNWVTRALLHLLVHHGGPARSKALDRLEARLPGE